MIKHFQLNVYKFKIDTNSFSWGKFYYTSDTLFLLKFKKKGNRLFSINFTFFVVPKISYTRGNECKRESSDRRIHTHAQQLFTLNKTLSAFLEGVEKRGNVFNFPRVYYPTVRRFPRDFTGDGAWKRVCDRRVPANSKRLQLRIINGALLRAITYAHSFETGWFPHMGTQHEKGTAIIAPVGCTLPPLWIMYRG